MPAWACAALLLMVPAAARAESWDARLISVEGEVTLFSGSAEDGAPAEADMPIEDGDRLVTGPESRAELALDAESLIELGPDSEFIVGSLDSRDSWFTLKLGILSAKLRRLLSDSRLRVRTQGAVAALRGTEFSVETSGAEDTAVAVFDEGEVSVSNAGEDADSRVTLGANQETEVLRGRGPLPPRALRRMARLRERLKHIRSRRESLRKRWKALPPDKRRELRERLLRTRQGRRERLQERGRQGRERLRKRSDEKRGRGKDGGKRR